MVQHGGPTKIKNPVFRNINNNGKPLKNWQTSARLDKKILKRHK